MTISFNIIFRHTLDRKIQQNLNGYEQSNLKFESLNIWRKIFYRKLTQFCKLHIQNSAIFY